MHAETLANLYYNLFPSEFSYFLVLGKQYIFAKDAAYQLGGRFDAIPEGFQHTFLIRNPSKTVRSLYNIILNGEETGWTYFDASEVGFKQLMELFKHVTTTLCQEAIVIDADDLFKNSAGILKKYCQKIGMEYKDSMIQWDDSSKSFQQNFTKMWHPWLKNAFTTKKFEDTLQGKKQDKDMPEVFHEAIKESMHIYYELYKYKLEANA
ncbi:DgyrCDS7128 [Dimorphilus gyrociliatus]|uniref:DgyrCDS7128 n=1 Tax=Dimorphilus gyrociliatus TaxID=2664684 RepID=A0A7I8VV26_9ANNE|nr:DgyrCDS7128 [Dimorphilus gyrociliatus]